MQIIDEHLIKAAFHFGSFVRWLKQSFVWIPGSRTNVHKVEKISILSEVECGFKKGKERTLFDSLYLPSKYTTSFRRRNNVVDFKATLYQRPNDVVCLLGKSICNTRCYMRNKSASCLENRYLFVSYNSAPGKSVSVRWPKKSASGK